MHHIPARPADEGRRYSRTDLRRPGTLARALTEPDQRLQDRAGRRGARQVEKDRAADRVRTLSLTGSCSSSDRRPASTSRRYWQTMKVLIALATKSWVA